MHSFQFVMIICLKKIKWSDLKWPHMEKIDMQLVAETKAKCLNRKLNSMWLAKHCKVLDCIQEVSVIGVHAENGYFVCLWAFLLAHQYLGLKMAQGKDQSFGRRLFHKYLKNSQEQKGQESEVPHISEFTIMWDKFSKCSVSSLLWGVFDSIFRSRMGFCLCWNANILVHICLKCIIILIDVTRLWICFNLSNLLSWFHKVLN